ncbi:hypothetical protein ILUMI_23440 [Ignelater luminosus]|uniref:Uncharacterized protein n=1 Tax=Ignelater luminosus TaxID=2038154 RepID=A0A8K0CCF4_IGNLU|nr:hypothetical protein ILUMI_23440 [Ignelater luminosus]
MWGTKTSALIFLNGFFILVQCRLEPEARLQAEKECVDQTKVDYNLVLEVMRTIKVPDDEKYKEYLNCFYLKQGFKNKAGEIQFDALKEVLMVDGEYDEHTADKILYPCKKIAPPQLDDLPALVLQCIFDNAP